VRRLFVYWKLSRADLAAALAAARTLQHALQTAHPSLRCALLERADDAAAAEATLMETYAADGPGGVDAALQAVIESAAAGALARYQRGPRHVEVFEPR
jgi:hypothetical protein